MHKRLTLKQVFMNEGRKFINLEQFKSMSPSDQIKYLENNGHYLGKGSARAVWAIDSKRVIKLARNKRGVAQNEAEVMIYFTEPSFQEVINRIYEYDQNYRWVVSELVRPLTSSEEFSKLTGLSSFSEYSDDLIDYMMSKDIFGEKYLNKLISSIEQNPAGKFMEKILSVAIKSGLEYGDLAYNAEEALDGLNDHLASVQSAYDKAKTGNLDELHGELQAVKNEIDKVDRIEQALIGHYGKTADGRVVLLDYGFTQDVNRTEYSKPAADSNVPTVKADSSIPTVRKDQP